MERNIREFLRETGADGLKARGVLSPHRRHNYLLRGVNVMPLIALMREGGVSKLISHDGKWFLTAAGTFANPKSREAKGGAVKSLELMGNVFWGQNACLNPYFDPALDDPATRFVSSSVRPLARITFGTETIDGKPGIRDTRVSIATIIELMAAGNSIAEVLQSYPALETADIQEALAYAAKKIDQVNTYLFRIEVEQDDDGRWGAVIPTLPGCIAWGYTRAEALEALRGNAQDFLEVIEEFGDTLPPAAEQESRLLSGEVVTVTL